ncbi:MAG: fasciclin domain-containing protein [Granulosicoccus sp.]
MKHFLRVGLFSVCLIALAGCSDNSSPDPAISLTVQDEATGNVSETINSQPEFTILSDAMARTGLDSVLADTNRKYTMFAPTDAAFTGLGEATLSNLFSDANGLSYILSYHFLPDMSVDSATAAAFAGRGVPAANGVNLQVSLAPSRYNANPQAVYINEAEVFVGDVPATNGVIHAVDRVLLPPGVGGSDGDGDGTDGGGTDSGGTDSGGTDSGGTDSGGTDSGGDGNLMEAITADEDLDTLVDALRRTGLDSLLSDTSRRFTIFAPTDTAFGIYDPFEIILNDTNKLEETLRYHVVADEEIDLNEVSDLSGTRVTMANGDTVFISSFQESLFLNFYARLEGTEIRATNGIIHKINGVLFTSN